MLKEQKPISFKVSGMDSYSPCIDPAIASGADSCEDISVLPDRTEALVCIPTCVLIGTVWQFEICI